MRVYLPSICLAAAAFAAPAQDQATTLLHACQRADVVVRATVLAATDPSPEWHRLEFRSDEVLAGAVGADFQLLEPAGACCGRSLFALQPGATCLLFLQRTGPALHPFGGGRGVLPATPELLLHVRSLLAAGDDDARAGLLAAALDSPEPRIAQDAAHALAVLPVLRLAPTARRAVTERLDEAVRSGRTTAPALLDVVVRLCDDSMLDATIATYLAAEREDQARLVREGLLRLPPAQVAARVLPALSSHGSRVLRGAELLAALPFEHAALPLQALARQGAHPRAQLCVAESMLAAGHRREQLVGLVAEPVLRLAEERRKTPRTFRSVRPARR